MEVLESPDTGMIELVSMIELAGTPAEEELTYSVFPALDGRGEVAVFADGSFTRWLPGN